MSDVERRLEMLVDQYENLKQKGNLKHLDKLSLWIESLQKQFEKEVHEKVS